MNRLGGWALGVSVFACVACGGVSDTPSGAAAGASSDSSSGAGGRPTAAAGASSSGSSGSAGAPGNAGAGGVPASAGTAGQADVEATYSGVVQVGWYENALKFSTGVSASFSVPNQASALSCTTEVFGPCRVNTCVSAVAAPAMPQAGVISVSNGEMFSATLTPNSDGSYPGFSETGISLPGEDQITISATGGDVPAFSGIIVQPLALLITAPVADSNGEVSWSRDTDLAVKFERGVPKIQLVIQGGASPGALLGCTFPSETGLASIPAAALQAMPLGTRLTFFTYHAEPITAGEYTIVLKNFSAAMSPDKAHGIHLTLQ